MVKLLSIIFLIYASVEDIRERKISHFSYLIQILLGLYSLYLSFPVVDFSGLLVPIIFGILAYLRKLGMGDFKISVGLGLIFGESLIFSTLLAMIIALIHQLIKKINNSTGNNTLNNPSINLQNKKMPMVPYLLMGIIFSYISVFCIT